MSDWWLIGVRFALYISLAALFGLPAFCLYGVRGSSRYAALPLRPWLLSSALAALLLSAAWLLLLASSMAGTPVWPIDQEAVEALLAPSAIATAWKLRVVAIIVAILVGAYTVRGRLALGAITVCGAISLATLAWTGHGAMDDTTTGRLHLAADILHLLASSIWVGALIGLSILVARPAALVDVAHLELTHKALHGFGGVGTFVVGAIIITGVVNSWVLVGPANLVSLPQELYGQLLLAKLGLFTGMLVLASLNRFRLAPALERAISTEDFRGATGALRTSLAIETAAVIIILALVAWLGTLAPPASAM